MIIIPQICGCSGISCHQIDNHTHAVNIRENARECYEKTFPNIKGNTVRNQPAHCKVTCGTHIFSFLYYLSITFTQRQNNLLKIQIAKCKTKKIPMNKKMKLNFSIFIMAFYLLYCLKDSNAFFGFKDVPLVPQGFLNKGLNTT